MVAGWLDSRSAVEWSMEGRCPVPTYVSIHTLENDMRLIIAGGRDFANYALLMHTVDDMRNKAPLAELIIISGTARGADQLGEQYAKDFDIQLERYPALWDVYGRSAGYKRNEQMAGVATHCMCFWDGKSRGTKHMIDIANREGLALQIVEY